jgi:hypothetical protein
MRKLKLSELRSALPPETPTVTPDAREAALRKRRVDAQKRTIW